LVEVTGPIHLVAGSLAEELYGTSQVEEGYRCNYGVSPSFAPVLRNREDVSIQGTDDSGDIRIFRLPNHPFFWGTLFQPERSSLQGLVHPLIRGFVAASAHIGTSSAIAKA
jgi:CTP synthase (UTP-ammonia lyase)